METKQSAPSVSTSSSSSLSTSMNEKPNNKKKTRRGNRLLGQFRRRRDRRIGAVDSTRDHVSARKKPTLSRSLSQELEDLNFSDGTSELQIDQDSIKYSFQQYLLQHVNLSTTTPTAEGKKRRVSRNLSVKQRQCPPKHVLQEKIHQDYTEILLDQAYLGDHGLAVHLRASQHVLQEFLYFHERIVACTTTVAQQTYRGSFKEVEILSPKVRRDIFRVVEDYLRPRIMDQYQSGVGDSQTLLDDKLTPEHAAQVITWMEHWFERIETVCPELTISSVWKSDLERLREFYLERGVKQGLRELLQRSASLQSSDDLRRNQEGHFVTGHPESVVFMIQSQLKVADEMLPPKYKQMVLAACNEELSALVEDMMLQIGTGWHNLGASRFCAMINDSFRLTDLMDGLNTETLVKPEYQEKGETLLRELTQLSLHAATFLCERIVFDLKDPKPILTSIGSPEWETEEKATAIACTIATLKDYFTDIPTWLASDFYFPKILKMCIDLVLQTYVESFFCNTMAHGVKDPKTVSKALDDDHLRLVVFINSDTFADYFGRGFYTQHELNARLGIIKNLSNVMDPSNDEPGALLEDVKEVIRQIDDGTPAILHLAGLGKRHNQVKSVEWLGVIARAKKDEPDSSNNNCGYYKLVDLRNSKHLRNIRPNQAEMKRRISQASLRRALSASKLLTPANKKFMGIGWFRSPVSSSS